MYSEHFFNPKRQSHKMVKHTKTIRLQFDNELFECVWPFCEIGAQRVNTYQFLFEKW